MGIAFVPLYIKYIGIEAYGLIGIFAILQASLSLLDMGLKPALGREMARYTAGAHDPQSIRDLLRSVEIIGVAISIVVAIGIWAAAGWLASDWVTAKKLPTTVVSHAFVAMGIVIALRFVESIYVSSIVGLQRQVLESVIGSVMATARGLGAVVVLAWLSPTVEAYFAWQGFISLLTVPILAACVYRTLPRADRAARFSWPAIAGIRQFALGVMAITLLALLLTQIDKILLSRILSLKNFAYYALAGVVTNALYVLASPISAAFYPQFTELATRGDPLALQRSYHQAAQLATVVLGGAAIALAIFSSEALAVWTQNPELVVQVAPLVRVLALGTLLNGLMGIPYQMQLAHGWTGLTIKVNVVAVAILVPAIFFVVPRYGAIGAAWVWVVLNVGYLVVDIYFMHRRILRSEKWPWYRQDVLAPLTAAIAAGLACRALLQAEPDKMAELGMLTLAAALIWLAAALFAPIVRAQLGSHVHIVIDRLRRRA